MTTTYQPKGGMCAVCKKRAEDCSALPFRGMQVLAVIHQGRDTINVVRCSEFERADVVDLIRSVREAA